jgi:hypothetical protein
MNTEVFVIDESTQRKFTENLKKAFINVSVILFDTFA